MNLPKLLPLLACVLLLSFSCSKDSADTELEATLETSFIPKQKPIEVEALNLINEHRVSMGLSPLIAMSTIKAVAYTHTDYMIQKAQVSHDNFYLRKHNLSTTVGAKKVAENVGYGYTEARYVVNAWLNSPGHREVIEGDYTHFEISAEKNHEERWYFTNIFIKM